MMAVCFLLIGGNEVGRTFFSSGFSFSFPLFSFNLIDSMRELVSSSCSIGRLRLLIYDFASLLKNSRSNKKSNPFRSVKKHFATKLVDTQLSNNAKNRELADFCIETALN
jgi:hypothetical protein